MSLKALFSEKGYGKRERTGAGNDGALISMESVISSLQIFVLYQVYDESDKGEHLPKVLKQRSSNSNSSSECGLWMTGPVVGPTLRTGKVCDDGERRERP